MALTLTSLRPTTREPVTLADGQTYPVRDITIGGAELVDMPAEQRLAMGDAFIAALLDEAHHLTGAPIAVLKRHTFEDVFQILWHAADRLDKVRAAITASLATEGEATAPAPGAPPAPSPSPTDATGSASP